MLRNWAGRSVDAAVRAIFASGVDGYYADPFELWTAYQDSAGTTAGAVDQPVGLRLDKSDGAVRGVELVAGQTFTANSANTTGGVLTASFSAAANGANASATIAPLVVGEYYEVSYTVSGLSAGSVYVDMGGGSLAYARTANGTYSEIKQCLANPDLFFIGSSAAGTTATVTLNSVRSLLGNHTTQSTGPARPLLKSINGYWWEELDGTDDFRTSATGGGGTTGFFYCAPVYVAGGAGATRILWSDRGTTAGYGVYISTANVLSFVAGNGSADTTVATAATLPVGEAHIVTAWDDGTNLCVQIDNGTVATAARPAVAAGTAGFTEGRFNGAAGSYFNGRLGTREYFKNYSPDSATREQIKRFVAIRNGITL